MAQPVALVVEDDPIIRLDVAMMFEDVGYEVLEAATADAALDYLASRADVTILVTDVDMPGEMSGLELAHETYRRWPTVEIIICSGAMQPNSEDMPEPALFLDKPVDRMTLVEKAEETLLNKGLNTST